MRRLALLLLVVVAEAAQAIVITGNIYNNTVWVKATTSGKYPHTYTAAPDPYGNYYIYIQEATFTGTIAPIKQGRENLNFFPPSFALANQADDFVANFYSAPAISGTLYSTNGAVITGQNVVFTKGSSNVVVQTDYNGFYLFRPSLGWYGTFSASNFAGLAFYPEIATVASSLGQNRTQNFTLGGAMVSGAVVDGTTGEFLDGVGIAAIGTTNPVTAYTTNGGQYSISLPMGWTGVLVPVSPGGPGYYIPDTTNFVGLSNFVGGVNFSSHFLHPLISGRVVTYSSGSGVADVPLVFASTNGDSQIVSSGSDGYYSLAVSYGWSGSVRPNASPLVFLPATKAYTNLSASMSRQNFKVAPSAYTNATELGPLTNKLDPAAGAFTYARDDQVVTRTLGMSTFTGLTLRADMSQLDVLLGTYHTNVQYQLDAMANLDPAYYWATGNYPVVWGNVIAGGGLWSSFQVEFTNLVIFGALATDLDFGVAALSNDVPASVVSWFDEDLVPLAPQAAAGPVSWVVAPAFTAAYAAVYSVDAALRGTVSFSTNLPSVTFSSVLSGGVGHGGAPTMTTFASDPAVVSTSIPPVTLHGSLYLDAGAVFYPVLTFTPSATSTDLITVAVAAAAEIRVRSTMQSPIRLWR